MKGAPAVGSLQKSSYKWVVVGMLWFVCFFNYADRQAIFSVFPLIKQQLNLSDFQLGVVGASFMWMYAIFGPFAGWLCDLLSRKALVLGGLIFWSLVTAATAVTHNYTQLVACRALGGLGEAFYLPAAMSLISDYHGISTRSRAMSLHQSSVYAGSIAGGAASGIVGQYYGWRLSFSLLGVAGIILGLVLLGLLREPARGMSDSFGPDNPVKTRLHDGNLASGFLEVFQNRIVILLILVFIGANFVAVIFLTWMPTFLYEKFHVNLSMAGLNGTAYLQMASVFGVFSGGLMADALIKRNPGGRLLVQSFGLLCGAPFLFLAGWTISMPFLILAMVGFGYFKGLYEANIFAGLYDIVPMRRRGVAAGMLNSIGWLGGGFAPIAVALAASHYGMSVCISATAGIYVFIGLLLFWGSRRLSPVPRST